MATTLMADSAGALFRSAIELVLEEGVPVSPRGHATREVLGVHLRLTRPRARLVHLPPGRLLNPAFAAAESVWIVSGTDAPWIFLYNDRLRQYADGGVLRGAYGPRMRRWGPQAVDQLRRVVDLLRDDPDSRRAVIQLFDPSRDAMGHRDVPCTLGYRFHLRNGSLDMATTMRSQDAWIGLPYDLYSATVIHELVAGWLDVELGTYNHYVDSLHVYERDLPDAEGLPDAPGPVEMEALGVSWDRLDGVVADVIAGSPTGHRGWDVVAATMRSYRMWKAGNRAAALAAVDAVDGPLGSSLNAWYERLSSRTATREAVKR